ncbi:uncharacterized protein LOC111319456 [Stylophora pistillata]|uniref:uncharacterized protein LOC111319456 n=1 Tax=Stylophora pistillata TaxID=50429 RepID=UPI000C049BFB|nr:uncharacterized protein LOC111319456 [Stylophora pistillata]
MIKIFISNIGFGITSPDALIRLKKYGTIIRNDKNKRFNADELASCVANCDILIAGTEPITKKVFDKASSLRLIGRVGVGLDNIELEAAKHKKTTIIYTPDAPSYAMAEFTLSLMLNLIKNISIINNYMHNGQWMRFYGKQLSSLTIGIIGVGRVGRKVISLLKSSFPNLKILMYDPYNVENIEGVDRCSLIHLIKKTDIVSLHLPRTLETTHLLNKNNIFKMKKGSYLINTSRGEVVDEKILYDALKSGHLAGAALDVFEQEPYMGPLKEINNCILTSHIGSMTYEARALMEKQLVDDVINFITGQTLKYPVPNFDFSKET